MFVEHPVLGYGPHTFATFYQQHLAGLTIPYWTSVDSAMVPWPHNIYLEVLAEQGLVGAAALSVLLFAGCSESWRTRFATSKDVRIYGAATLSALLALMVAGVVELTFLRQWVVIMLFVLLGLAAKLAPRREQTRGGD